MRWRFIPRKGFGHLSSDPFCGRIAGDCDPDHSPPGVTKNHEPIEQSERDRADNEQVDRSDSCGVIAQERFPALRPQSPGPDHISSDRRLADLDPEHQQLAMDPWRFPVGFSLLMRRISARSSPSILGLPPHCRDFQRQYARNPRRCQRSTLSGLTMTIASSSDGNRRYSHTRTSRSTLRSRTRVGDLRVNTSSCWLGRRFRPHATHGRPTSRGARARSD
jgi:hypothetical protein